MPVQKIPFYTLSLRELAETLVNDGFEKFRARQIFDGVYAKKIFNPREFPSIPSKLAEYLSERFDFEPAEIVGGRKSDDSTKKYMFKLSDGNFV